MSVYREYLKSIGWEIFGLLGEYIKLNNSIFNFWNILKWFNFFYKKSSQLLIVYTMINDVEDRLRIFQKENHLDDASKKYILCFLDYTAALNKTICLLREWLKMMGDSRNPDKQNYTREEINNIFDQHKKAEEEYGEIGKELKVLFEKL